MGFNRKIANSIRITNITILYSCISLKLDLTINNTAVFRDRNLSALALFS